jgi:hypothetical protein
MTTTGFSVEALIRLGGQRWERNGRDRVYFNLRELAALYGLDCNFYGTGNISSATLDGQRISNSAARRIAAKLSGKFWYDVPAGRFSWQDIPDDVAMAVVSAIAARTTAEEGA